VTPRLDHVGLDVCDYEHSKAFYVKALAPLGIALIMEPIPKVGGFGADFPFFWIAERVRGPDSGVHVAFTADNRPTVDAFHAAALDAGGTDNGEPVAGRSTTPTTTARSYSIPTATTSRPSVTPPPERANAQALLSGACARS